MPYRRTYRRRTFRKKRYTGRNYRRKFTSRMRAKGHPKDFVHYYKRKCTLADVVVQANPGVDPVLGAYSFALGDVPNFTDFVNLYDQYKLKGVKLSFIPVSNVVANSSGGSDGHPQTFYSNRLFTAIDYTHATPTADVDALREYQNCKWTPYNRIHNRWVRPAWNLADNATDAPQWPGKNQPWISTASQSASSYVGLLFGMEALTGTGFTVGDVLYKVEATYYLAFKSPR